MPVKTGIQLMTDTVVIIGIAIAAKVITGTGALVAGIARGILLITVGFCGLYAVLGISTCPVAKKGR